MIRLGIDANSGDRIDKNGEFRDLYSLWVEASLDALERHSDLEIILAGNKNNQVNHPRLNFMESDFYFDMIGNVVESERYLVTEITDQDYKKSSKETSYSKLLQSLKNDSLDGVISGNNTAVLISQIIQNRIKRLKLSFRGLPPLCSEIPNLNGGSSTYLDLGSHPDSSFEDMMNNVAFGLAYAHIFKNLKKPSIGLVSNGVEEGKGNNLIKHVNSSLKGLFNNGNFSELGYNPNYLGMIEPKGQMGFMEGNCDVYVMDGFTGNIALKSMEQTAAIIGLKLKSEILNYSLDRSSPLAIFASGMNVLRRICGASALSSELRNLKKFADPSRHNGAPVLGFEKPVFKSHGRVGLTGMEAGIDNAYNVLKSGKFELYNEETQNLSSLIKNSLDV